MEEAIKKLEKLERFMYESLEEIDRRLSRLEMKYTPHNDALSESEIQELRERAQESVSGGNVFTRRYSNIYSPFARGRISNGRD